MIRILKQATRGFGPVEIPPRDITRVVLPSSPVEFFPTILALTDACASLQIVEVATIEQQILARVPAQRYTSKLLEASDAELVDQIRGCFAHRDHALEEYLKVVELFRRRATGRGLDGPRPVKPGESLWITFRNPTELPVLAMGVFEGKETIE